MNDGQIKSITNLGNVLALCKSIAVKEARKSCYIDLALSALTDYANSVQSSPEQDDSENTCNKLEFIQFVIEQLQLHRQSKHGRRYSANMLTLAFLCQLTSTSLYKKLRDVLLLPSISRLQQYSSALSVETGVLDLSYLGNRTKNLTENERMVTLMIDEVYTAQRIEYNNGSFTGLTEDGVPAKTVLTFMVQSVCSKYKDVVCLIPVNCLDTALLQRWFEKVMHALDGIFFVVAVSVDNHICNRYLLLFFFWLAARHTANKLSLKWLGGQWDFVNCFSSIDAGLNYTL